MSLLSLLGFQRRSTPTRNNQAYSAGWLDSDRLLNYQRFMLAYRGYSLRHPTTSVSPLEQRRLRHNLNRPIVNLGAAFMAAKPLKWDVDKNAQASKAAMNIWDRSGSDRALLDAARCGGIMGDMVGLAAQDSEGRPKIEFICPDIAFPQFSGSDSSRLEELDIAWQEEDRQERTRTIREFFTAEGREKFIDGEEQPVEVQAWDAIPAVWIRNLSVKGRAFGFSDLDGVTELVEEYDHVAAKRTRILDYYAEPTIVFPGMKSTDLQKTMGTTFWTTTVDQKPYFLEWSGNQPDVETQLARLRNDISEITQVPAVAFGRQDSGFSSISGIALRILYGPLLAKTQEKWANWGPPLEYLMWLCLRQEGIAVELEAVNALWQDPLPADELALAQGEKAAGEAGGRSLETIARRLGAEDPKAEVRQVEKDRRYEHLAALVKAGVDVLAAARLAGFEAAVLEEIATAAPGEVVVTPESLPGSDPALFG